MIDTEYVKYPPTSIDDIKDEKLMILKNQSENVLMIKKSIH